MHITFKDDEREKLYKIYKLLGQAALNTNSALLISSCNVKSEMAYVMAVDDEQLMKKECYSIIKIHNYVEMDIIENGSRPVRMPSAYPNTYAVKSAYDEINNDNENNCIYLLCALVGILCIGLSSMAIGAFPLIFALESLVYMYVDNGIFVKKLQHYDQESILIQGSFSSPPSPIVRTLYQCWRLALVPVFVRRTSLRMIDRGASYSRLIYLRYPL